ncbi:MAG: response regulator [Ignavibacteria bacterium]
MTKVLVIEDAPDIREQIKQVLTIEGYDVELAENGRIGVKLAKELLPDIILCDINMPELDGYGVITEIREDKKTAPIPFIFLTARLDKQDVREGMNLGADDYLNKPFTIEELIKSIESRIVKSQIVKNETKEKLDELRANISMSVPHELRTPLNVIIGFAGILTTDLDNLDRTEILEMSAYILENGRRLEKTVEKYLLYTHLRMLSVNRDALDLLFTSSSIISNEVIEEIFETTIKVNQRKDDLTIITDRAALIIREDYLGIIIEQIGKNCFEYSQAGSPVLVQGIIRDGYYMLSFIDHGRGLSDEQIASIGGYTQFDRNVHEQQGTGLGLAISKSIVQIFGGRISVSSTPGSETRVTVSFKLSK